ncbi:MAG TPA: hypothetical protein DCQ51_20185 [Planktothrix sp. UBA8407]|nr:hypothetical protein [Planktothrix sp. UBA8407]HBK24653.1 hypothetical protein [Planktothrix sp. UBA10369]
MLGNRSFKVPLFKGDLGGSTLGYVYLLIPEKIGLQRNNSATTGLYTFFFKYVMIRLTKSNINRSSPPNYK